MLLSALSYSAPLMLLPLAASAFPQLVVPRISSDEPEARNTTRNATEPYCYQPVAPDDNQFYYTTRIACNKAINNLCGSLSKLSTSEYIERKAVTEKVDDCLVTMYVSNMTTFPTTDQCKGNFTKLADKCANSNSYPAQSNLGAINAGNIAGRDYFLDHGFVNDPKKVLFGIASTDIFQAWRREGVQLFPISDLPVSR
ncbi:MAG: hypothetical protein M1825_000641 [Sarcosagium campestre]|nr:MAG: hypothetical protein M1825_000641 [Sarcosagium campestre]